MRAAPSARVLEAASTATDSLSAPVASPLIEGVAVRGRSQAVGAIDVIRKLVAEFIGAFTLTFIG